MLKDLKLQSQTLEVLCDKARVFGTINSIEEIHKKKSKNSVLIGKIIEIGKLIRRDGVILRDSFQFVMKELCANGKYGNYFLAILFDDIAIETHTAKFMLSDKLLFCNPQVFVNPQFDQQKRPRFLIQVGLCHDEDEVVWYSRKHSEESAVMFASPSQKKLMKIDDNENPSCSNSNTVVNSVKNNLTKLAEKNTRINENNKQKNKNTSVTTENWVSRENNKNRSNIIHKRLLFARNNDAPFLSDSDVFNNSATQTDPEVSRSSPSLSLGNNNNNNNNIERDSTVAACVTGNNETVISKYFSNKSPVKHKMSPESIMKPVVISEYDSRKDDSSGSQRNKESDTSDFLNILEEVSVAMKLKYLSSVDQTKSKNESPKKVLEANTNSVEEVTLDTDTDADDPVELITGTQQCRNILFNNTKTFKSEDVVLKDKKIKSNCGRRTVKTATVLSNHNSMHNKPKHKQVKPASSHSASPGKASSSILTLKNSCKNSKCNNDSMDLQALNAEKEKRKKKLKDGAISCVQDRKMVSNKIKESEMLSVEQKTKTNEVRHKHEEKLRELEASHTLSIEDNKKMNDSITSNTSAENSSASTSPNKTSHEVGDSICNDNCKADITLADKTTPRKLIPVLKSPFDNDKQIVGQQHRKKRVSFVLSDEENETRPIGNSKSVLLEDHKARPGINSKSVLANDDFADYILNVLLQSSQTDTSDNNSTGDCDAVMQGTEKCSTLIRNQFSDTVISKHIEIGSKDTVESLNALHDESLSLSPSLLSHSHNTLSAGVNNDNSVAVNPTHSDGEVDERSNCVNTVQPVITKEKVLKKLLSDSRKKKVVINAGYITNKSQGSSSTDNTSVADSISEQQRTMITTAAKTIGPCSAQNSIINHVGMKRKLDDKTSCCDGSSEYKGIDLAKIQKFVSQLTPDYSRSSSCMLVEVNWPAMLKRDVGVSASYSESDADDCNPDVSGDPEGRWFVLSGASLIDVYPPLSGNALELVSGFCNHNCFHRYSELIWVKNDTGESVSVCPTAFKEGIRKQSPVMFLFTFVVTDREGKCYNLRVYKEHAETLLCCKVTDFIMDREKRAQVIASIKSYITTSAVESSTLETTNKKKLTLCVYDKGSMQIVVRRVQTSTLKL